MKHHYTLVGPAWPLRGGIAHFAENTARELTRWHDVRMLSFTRQYPEFLFPGRTQYDESPSRLDVPSDVLIDSVNPLSWWRARQLLREQEPDGVVFNWWQPFFAPCYASIGAGLPLPKVLLAHNVLSHERRAMERGLVRLVLSAMDHVVVLSDETEAMARELVAPRHITRLFHPVYTFHAEGSPWTRASARAELGLDEEQPVAVFFGYVRSYKGVATLLEAWRTLGIEGARLFVVGEIYDEREELHDAATKAEGVTLVDRYVPDEEVALYLRAADLMVLPYLRGSQSGAGNTAIAFDLPMVVSELPGLVELIDGGACGESAAVGDAGALAEALKRCLQKGHEAYAPGLASRRERYSWRRFGEEMNELLGMLGSRRRPR